MIDGQYVLGATAPMDASITSAGIDTVENILNQSIIELENNPTNEQIIPIEEIKRESSSPSKFKKMWEYAKDNPELLLNFGEKLARIFAGLG